MKDWAKERWRKLYLREALDQRLWSVMARGLRDYLIRLAEDDGALIRDADDPVEALLLALGTHADEADLVRDAIVLLRRDGFLSGGARSMFVRNLPTAQTWEPRPSVPPEPEAPLRSIPVSSSNERVRQFRERQRQAANPASATVASSAQNGTAAPTPVTPSVTGNVASTVSSPVTGVTSTVTAAVTSNVTSSRGSRKPRSSQSFLDLQRDKQPAHRPRSSCASGVTSSVTRAVTSSVTSPVAGVTPAVTSDVSVPPETEDEDDQFDFSFDSGERSKASIRERALALRDQPTLAATTHAEQWPEVVGVAQAFARGSGLSEHRLGEHGTDPGVRSILALYAAGFTQIELERVAEFVPKLAWWRSKALGLSSLSPEVVRRNLSAAMASDLSPRLAKVLADVERRREVG